MEQEKLARSFRGDGGQGGDATGKPDLPKVSQIATCVKLQTPYVWLKVANSGIIGTESTVVKMF